MKKALVILMVLAMIIGAFADEPVDLGEVVQFDGWANVSWGIVIQYDPDRSYNSGVASGTGLAGIAMPQIAVDHAKIHFGDMFYTSVFHD